MKRLVVLFAVILPVFASLTSTGCSSKPADEIKMARIAMGEAQRREASSYAPDDWDRARWDWEEANALINIGRYAEARNVLTLAIAEFNTARDTSGSRLEAITREVSDLQISVKLELSKLEQAAENANVKPSAKKKVDSSLPLIEEKISSMRAAIDAKDYLRARMLGKEAWRRIMDLQESIGIKH